MKGKTNQRRWKNYLIRKDLQLPIIAGNLIFLGIVVAVLIGILLSPLYYDMLFSDKVWAQNLSGNLFLVLLQRLALAMFLILVLAVAHQILFSHRFCGPLINFGHTFAKMAGCDFTRKIHLRKHDFLKSEADQVNAILDRLNAEGKTLRDSVTRIASICAQLEQSSHFPEEREFIRQLNDSAATCKDTLDSWRLS